MDRVGHLTCPMQRASCGRGRERPGLPKTDDVIVDVSAVGAAIAMWVSRDRGREWRRARMLTSGSRHNHGYVRRPVNAHPGFYGFWADGNADAFSESHLYFCTRAGKVFRLPRRMRRGTAKPEPVE